MIAKNKPKEIQPDGKAIPVAALSPDTTKKLEGIAFKQAQLYNSQERVAKSVASLEGSVLTLTQLADRHLSRIVTSQEDAEVAFHKRAFKKLSVRLMRHAIEVKVYDSEGAVRKFKCSDWAAFAYFMATQQLRDGIEEVTQS